MKLRANGLDIEVEDSAQHAPSHRGRPALLLIMGLSMQLTAWPVEMVQALEDAGFRVIRFDNRDAGLSTRLDHWGKPNVLWSSLKYKLGLPLAAPYTLSDMAADALGVLDALEVQHAHVLGVSMGGMIAQRVALAAPQRTRSLTSIMSTSSARGLPSPRGKVLRALLGRPADDSDAAAIEHTIHLFRTIGSPAYPFADDDLRARVTASVQRAHYPVGVLRQILALVTDSARADLLPRITAPTLVIHGTADRLLPLACGEDTARRIPGARLVRIEGMGHDLPHEPVRQILAAVIPHLQAHS